MNPKLEEIMIRLAKEFDDHKGDNPKDFGNERETVLTDVDLQEIDQADEEKNNRK